MAREHGLLVGGSTGSVLAAILGYGPGFAAGSRIAAISPDLGERYLRTVYDDAWVAERIGGAQCGPTTTLDPFAPVPALAPRPSSARVAV
jgi:cysteine synthase A